MKIIKLRLRNLDNKIFPLYREFSRTKNYIHFECEPLKIIIELQTGLEILLFSKAFYTYSMLCIVPININGYVPILINTLGTILRGGNILIK